jgi:hypothetical protein
MNPSSANLHGCFSRFAGDASQAPDFHSSEWTLVRNKKNFGKQDKKISKSNLGICTWQTVQKKKEVNFEVAPEDDKLTYLDPVTKRRRNNRCTKKRTKTHRNINMMTMTEIEKIMNELNGQEITLQEIKTNSELEIKKLTERLAHGIKLTNMKRILHEKLRRYVNSRMPLILMTTAPNLPLQNKVDKAVKTIREYERLNEEQSQNIEELKTYW